MSMISGAWSLLKVIAKHTEESLSPKKHNIPEDNKSDRSLNFQFDLPVPIQGGVMLYNVLYEDKGGAPALTQEGPSGTPISSASFDAMLSNTPHTPPRVEVARQLLFDTPNRVSFYSAVPAVASKEDKESYRFEISSATLDPKKGNVPFPRDINASFIEEGQASGDVGQIVQIVKQEDSKITLNASLSFEKKHENNDPVRRLVFSDSRPPSQIDQKLTANVTQEAVAQKAIENVSKKQRKIKTLEIRVLGYYQQFFAKQPMSLSKKVRAIQIILELFQVAQNDKSYIDKVYEHDKIALATILESIDVNQIDRIHKVKLQGLLPLIKGALNQDTLAELWPLITVLDNKQADQDRKISGFISKGNNDLEAEHELTTATSAKALDARLLEQPLLLDVAHSTTPSVQQLPIRINERAFYQGAGYSWMDTHDGPQDFKSFDPANQVVRDQLTATTEVSPPLRRNLRLSESEPSSRPGPQTALETAQLAGQSSQLVNSDLKLIHQDFQILAKAFDRHVRISDSTGDVLMPQDFLENISKEAKNIIFSNFTFNASSDNSSLLTISRRNLEKGLDNLGLSVKTNPQNKGGVHTVHTPATQKKEQIKPQLTIALQQSIDEVDNKTQSRKSGTANTTAAQPLPIANPTTDTTLSSIEAQQIRIKQFKICFYQTQRNQWLSTHELTDDFESIDTEVKEFLKGEQNRDKALAKARETIMDTSKTATIFASLESKRGLSLSTFKSTVQKNYVALNAHAGALTSLLTHTKDRLTAHADLLDQKEIGTVEAKDIWAQLDKVEALINEVAATHAVLNEVNFPDAPAPTLGQAQAILSLTAPSPLTMEVRDVVGGEPTITIKLLSEAQGAWDEYLESLKKRIEEDRQRATELMRESLKQYELHITQIPAM